MKKQLSLLLFLLLVSGGYSSAQAEDYSKARIVSSTQGTADLVAIDMGLEIAMKDQWYTYWRMPGDTGVAPVFDWSGSKNVKEVEVFWPTPKRFTTADMHSFGYDGTVLFPLRITPEKTGQDILVQLKLDLMICHDICIPQTMTIERLFRAGPAIPSDDATLIRASIDALPVRDGSDQLSIGTAILASEAVAVTVKSDEPLDEHTDMIVETQHGILTRPPEIIAPVSEGGDYVLKVSGPDGADLTQELFGKTINVMLIHKDKAIEKNITF